MRTDFQASFQGQTLFVLLVAAFSLSAGAVPTYTSIAKCWNSEFAIPNSPQLDRCTECNLDETGTLNCLCQNDDGQTKSTALSIYSCPKYYSFPRCADHIEVSDGELACKKISPESTYSSFCFSCNVDGSVLKCSCWQDFDRKHITTEIDMKGCDAPISSCDGVLTCGLCAEPDRTLEIWTKRIATGIGTIATLWLAKRFFWKNVRS